MLKAVVMEDFFQKCKRMLIVMRILTHTVTVMWSIAQERGVPGLFAVKLSISTVWKSTCTVCSPLPSLSPMPRDRLWRPAGSHGSRGQQQIQLVSTRQQGLEEPADWGMARERGSGEGKSGGGGGGTVKALIKVMWAGCCDSTGL